MPKLRVVEGELKGREFPLSGEKISLGRIEENTICLPEDSISSCHAFFRLKSTGDYALLDNNSTNGTQLNGEKLMGEKELKNGDRIRFGKIDCDYDSEVVRDPKTVSEPAKSEIRPPSPARTPGAPITLKKPRETRSPLATFNVILGLLALLALALVVVRFLGIL
ncbi:MAG: FHA domain-containing protein [Verrucomicrobiae bacterium]|nr:FHA domain-containing protein [Verrucomicrobiae bacterium]